VAGEVTSAQKKAQKLGDQWLTDLHDMWVKAQVTVRKTYTKYQKYHDDGKYDSRHQYPVGSRAYLSTRDLQDPVTIGREHKLGIDDQAKRKLLPFFIGPFEVLEVCGTQGLNRRLALSTTLNERLGTDVFHISKLKPAGESDEPFTVMDVKPPKNPSGEDHVEKILAFEQRAQGKRYLVKWERWDRPEDNTWEWEWVLENAQEKLREFHRGNPQPVNPTRAQRRSTRARRKTIQLVSTDPNGKTFHKVLFAGIW
jgi:hypothetical protein